MSARCTWIASSTAMLVDFCDLIIDLLFVFQLFTKHYFWWAILMLSAIILSHWLDWLYEPVIRSAFSKHHFGTTYLFYFGTSECLIFLVEDVVTIYLYASITGYNVNDWVDRSNIILTMVSAFTASSFILIGGGKMIIYGQTTSWIPELYITRSAKCIARRFRLDFKCVMTFFITLQIFFTVSIVLFFTYILVYYVLQDQIITGTLKKSGAIMLCMSFFLASALSLRSPATRCTVTRLSTLNPINLEGFLHDEESSTCEDRSPVVLP